MNSNTYHSIKEIRKALLMSSKQLANKLGKANSTQSELESREATGSITIKSLQEIAESLGCDFYYEFKPKKPIEEILLDQAVKEVRRELDNHTLYSESEILDDARIHISESTCLDWSN